MSHLRAGYGEQIITPPLGRPLTGYGCYLDRNAASVLDDLKVRAVFLRRGNERLILISCDLLGLTVEFSDAVREEIAWEQGLDRAGIFLACTHTHSGPASQPLIGMPVPDPEYLAQVQRAILAAADAAAHDEARAAFSYFLETIEPIGFNRRNRSFHPIDPVLKVAVLERADGKLYLMNYACHAVTLGLNYAWSADWPGAVVAAIEADGHRGIVFQGFLGDINPTANGLSSAPDKTAFLPYYGRLLYDRARLAEPQATREDSPSLRAVERRVDLPLSVPTPAHLETDYARWRSRFAGNAGFERALDEWHAAARACPLDHCEHPYRTGVPLQAASLGALQIVGFPGETFCSYGLRLRAKHPALLTLGHCGGNVGYLPTKDAFEVENDYAVHLASKLYALYPFAPGLEDLLLREAKAALGDLTDS